VRAAASEHLINDRRRIRQNGRYGNVNEFLSTAAQLPATRDVGASASIAGGDQHGK